jgi:hypothetical protein
MKIAIAALAAAIVLAGCQASSTTNRVAPSSAEIKNTTVVAEPFEVVWDRMIRKLSSDFFVINNVEKASRIMNVSFSASDPREFIDCGTTRRTFNGGTAGEQVYNYDSAAPSYVFRTAYNNAPFEINRRNSLEGRANIYAAPKDGGTEIVVNARYIVTTNTTVTALHPIYLNPQGSQTLAPDTFSFDTAKPITLPAQSENDAPLTCRAKGTLEQRVLDAAMP